MGLCKLCGQGLQYVFKLLFFFNFLMIVLTILYKSKLTQTILSSFSDYGLPSGKLPHFPIQKFKNIESSRLSVLISPTISDSWWLVWRISIARKSEVTPDCRPVRHWARDSSAFWRQWRCLSPKLLNTENVPSIFWRQWRFESETSKYQKLTSSPGAYNPNPILILN